MAKAAKSLNESLYAKNDVNRRNKNLPTVLPKRFIKPILFFMYVLNSLFKLLFYYFFLLLNNRISINVKNIKPQCRDKIFSVKQFKTIIIQNDNLSPFIGFSEILNKYNIKIKKDNKPINPIAKIKYK
jgi:hypothetical protein